MGKARKIVTLALGVTTFVSLVWFATAVAGRRSHASPSADQERIADLEQRLDNLQAAQLFRVVDKEGKPIFTVFSNSLRPGDELAANVALVYNTKRHGVIAMRAYEDGGAIETFSDPSNNGAVLESFDDLGSGLRISQRSPEGGSTREMDRATLGEGYAGGETKERNYSLRFPTDSGKIIAGIGQSKAGSGALIIGDAKGDKRASMFIGEKDKGMIGLFSIEDKPILAFGEAVGNDGGSLAIGDVNSVPMVKMGTNGNRYGVVLTFPPGFPYVPRSGLPGSYFLGCITSSKTCVVPQ